MTTSVHEEARRRAIDPTILARLKALGRPGHPPILGRLIDMYLEAAPELIGQIVTAIYYDDPRTLQDAAHLLKSKSVNLGVEVVADIARALENGARGTADIDANQLMSDLQQEYERAVNELLLERPFTEA